MTRAPKVPHSSVYRGVSKRDKTNMFDAAVWISAASHGSTHGGMQQYIGSFAREKDAARAYDLARVKLGSYTASDLNFSGINYKAMLHSVRDLTFDEYIQYTRRNRFNPAVIKDDSAPSTPHLHEEHCIFVSDGWRVRKVMLNQGFT